MSKRYMEIEPGGITREGMDALHRRLQKFPLPIALVWYPGQTIFEVWAAGDEGGGEINHKEWWQVEANA